MYAIDLIQLPIVALMSANCASRIPQLASVHDKSSDQEESCLNDRFKQFTRTLSITGMLSIVIILIAISLAKNLHLINAINSLSYLQLILIAAAQLFYTLKVFCIEPIYQIQKRTKEPLLANLIALSIWVFLAIPVTEHLGVVGFLTMTALTQVGALIFLLFKLPKILPCNPSNNAINIMHKHIITPMVLMGALILAALVKSLSY
jgi:peptidoglycan biosynthesis protein MviN/MurJ (putative lipid II flippase)